MTTEVRDALLAALDRLAGAGWEIREVTAPWLDQLRSWEDTLAVIVAREASQVHRGRDQTRYADGTRALLAYGAGVSDQEYARAAAAAGRADRGYRRQPGRCGGAGRSGRRLHRP